MKISFKTLKQESFELEIGEESQVKALKELLESEKKLEIKSIKLILKGKILQDDQVISKLGMSDKDFIVLMVTKQAPPPATPTTATTITPTTATNPVVPATSPVTPSVAVPATAAPAEPAPAQNFTELATGNSYEMAVGNLVEMGFARDQVVLAMRAAFNNPDRAAEYLMTGIPESAQAPQTTPTTATNPAAQSPAPATVAAQGQYTNLFQQAALEQRPAAPPSTNTDLETLRATPQFQQLRQMVQAQPHLLPAVLQQLQQTNPEIVQLISNNQDQFLQMLAEGQEGAEGAGEVITISPEENEAVNRLVALGFERNLAVEAYLACDKNEELAANYLFDMGGGDF